jgi:hypothetical protein
MRKKVEVGQTCEFFKEIWTRRIGCQMQIMHATCSVVNLGRLDRSEWTGEACALAMVLQH